MPHSPSQLIASLVLGGNGASTLAGTSRALASAQDRERFLALRRAPEISAILVGGRTFALEPYERAPHPIVRFTRASMSEFRTVTEYIASLKEKFPGVILCEGGATLIHLLLNDDLLDVAHISRVTTLGDDHFLDQKLLHERLSLSSSELIGATRFDKYKRA